MKKSTAHFSRVCAYISDTIAIGNPAANAQSSCGVLRSQLRVGIDAFDALP